MSVPSKDCKCAQDAQDPSVRMNGLCIFQKAWQIVFRVLVDQECDAGRWEDPDEVGCDSGTMLECARIGACVCSPSVEAAKALSVPDLLHHVASVEVGLARIVNLQPGADDLIRVCDAASKHLAHGTQRQEVEVGEPVLASAGDAPAILELLIRHELYRSMRNAEE